MPTVTVSPNSYVICMCAEKDCVNAQIDPLPVSAKRPRVRWVVYEQRNGEFIRLSRLFTTRAQAEKERDKLEARFTYKKVSLGVGVVAKE